MADKPPAGTDSPSPSNENDRQQPAPAHHGRPASHSFGHMFKSLLTPHHDLSSESSLNEVRHSATPSPDIHPAAAELAKSLSPAAGTPPKHAKRFTLLDDGSHEHCLKMSRRQEKISSMVREFLRVNKRRDEALSVPMAQDQVTVRPPSLIGQLASQVNDQPEALSNSILANASFVEKYGKCQGVVGKGAFGVVRVAQRVDAEHQEHLYAVKEFKKRPNEAEQQYQKRLTSEFCISSSLHHPNIIETLDLLQDSKGEYLEVMEYSAGGDLYSLILTAGKLEPAEADCFFKQIVRAVNYMHGMGVAHRDLKPENILLTLHGAVKITDFGAGECFRMAWESEVHFSSGVCGSEPYIAPEEFGKVEFDPRAVDIWSIGVIYMAMRTGRHLWQVADSKTDQFYREYLQGRKDANGYEPIESLKKARCRNVIYSILDPVPSRRITGKQIINSEWGREIKVCEAGDKGL